MKIAVSSTEKNINSIMDDRFGRCDYFIIYDNQSKEVSFIENEGKKTGAGAGIVAAQQMIDKNVDILITGYLGPNAFKVFEGFEIEVFKCSDVKVEEALKAYEDNKLEKLTDPSVARNNI